MYKKNIMKTEQDIMQEMQEKVADAKAKKKRRPSLKMHERCLKIVRVMTHDEIKRERGKVWEDYQETMDRFPNYLKNFSAFRKSTEEHQERAVKEIFLREFGIKEFKRRLKELDYILNVN